MKLQGTLLATALLLSACASDPGREDMTAVRPADRPECQLASSSSANALARGNTASMVRDPCHPDESIDLTPRPRDTIKPDFSGTHD
ncbi:hypothetical protein [Pseudoxanthomonas sp. JBR18]|uniref:hypothetical protein n=1 Tax=Pseudoxanthomonas sp. JBR18 TaxID=2969308 RepID=UPI002305A306|nr:hypothetical protein [Pseudoxanthomonas sp. JBR18]WCE03257.1 hypothetical protein PJ250_14220 [Pseudoxanthomonas sp. JBR18]